MDADAMRRLKSCRHKLTRQQYLTLRGRVLAGDIVGAMKGLDRILSR